MRNWMLPAVLAAVCVAALCAGTLHAGRVSVVILDGWQIRRDETTSRLNLWPVAVAAGRRTAPTGDSVRRHGCDRRSRSTPDGHSDFILRLGAVIVFHARR